MRDAGVFGSLTLWLGYTLAYPRLQGFHATLPECPFYALTGHPCPFCGGTRSFAATWRGDLGRAVHLYPLGPLLFLATVAAVVALALALISGRALRVEMPGAWQRRLTYGVAAVLALQWAVKLVWLGNT